MQLFPDAVIINISPSQKKLLCDPAHAEYVQGIDLNDGRRPRIPIVEFPAFVKRLQTLKAALLYQRPWGVTRFRGFPN